MSTKRSSILKQTCRKSFLGKILVALESMVTAFKKKYEEICRSTKNEVFVTTADLVTFTGEIVNGRLNFLCSVWGDH